MLTGLVSALYTPAVKATGNSSRKEDGTLNPKNKESNEKPSAIIDLDVVTVAHWKGMQKSDADKLLAKIASKKFYIVTPFILLELLMEWNDKNLVQRIEDFYSENTDMWLSERMVKEQAEAIGIHLENLINELEASGVKQEDSVLVVIAAIFKIDYLITFNRKHLSGRKDIINKVIKKAGLQPIHITNPKDFSTEAGHTEKGSDKNHAHSLSLFKNLEDMPFFISSASLTGSTHSGITALAFHLLSLTSTSITIPLRASIFKPFAQKRGDKRLA